jgi:Domain of unknown function (DUF4331)
MQSRSTLLLLSCLLPLCLHASDHIDGPVTTKHAVTDLTDLYAFPSPSKPGRWTLVLNVYPMALKKSHFSSKVEYAFILREASVVAAANGTLKIRTNAATERTITCRFETPQDHARHTSTCDAGNGMKRTVIFNTVDATPNRSGLLFYTGLRSDPFFFNAHWASEWTQKGRLSKPENSNVMARVNVLSVVLECDMTALFGHEVGLLALAAQSSALHPASGKKTPLDRVGRPEVTNIILAARGKQKDLRDGYNLERPFRVHPQNAVTYRERITQNIGFYDGIDGVLNWTGAAKQNYAELLAEDYLVFNAGKTVPANAQVGYFTIESDLLKGSRSAALGGRKLTDDFMDRLYTLLLNAGAGKSVSDGVSQPTRRISNSFPYLAAPDNGLMNWIKTKLGRMATGSH